MLGRADQLTSQPTKTKCGWRLRVKIPEWILGSGSRRATDGWSPFHIVSDARSSLRQGLLSPPLPPSTCRGRITDAAARAGLPEDLGGELIRWGHIPQVYFVRSWTAPRFCANTGVTTGRERPGTGPPCRACGWKEAGTEGGFWSPKGNRGLTRAIPILASNPRDRRSSLETVRTRVYDTSADKVHLQKARRRFDRETH